MKKSSRTKIYRQISFLKAEQKKIKRAIKDESNSESLDKFLLEAYKNNISRLSELTTKL